MGHDIVGDVQEAIARINRILGDGVTTASSVCCYDPAQGVSKSENPDMDIPGGAMLLLTQTAPSGNILLWEFMKEMKKRGVTGGRLYAHSKCLYLYTILVHETVRAQLAAIRELHGTVEEFNHALDTSWEVVVEEGGSAPI